MVFGEEVLLKDFGVQMGKLIAYVSKYNRLDERAIDSILLASEGQAVERVQEEEIIVHGVSGTIFSSIIMTMRQLMR